MKGLAFHEHSDDPLAFLIKAETRSQYCHAAVLIDNANSREKIETALGSFGDGHLIVEAVWPKVRARLLRKEELSGIDVFGVPTMTPEMIATGTSWLLQQVMMGVTYDVPDLFRFVPQFRALLGEAKDDAYKHHTFCSMLRFNYVRFSGHPKLLNCHDYQYSPDKMGWSPFDVPAPKLA
jgi:hypothetical protein